MPRAGNGLQNYPTSARIACRARSSSAPGQARSIHAPTATMPFSRVPGHVIDALRVRSDGKDHAAAGTAECLVRGGGHYPCVRIRMRVRARDDELRDVRDVCDERRADRLGDLREARVIPNARIRRAAAEY